MNDVLEKAIAAHGGPQRWQALKCLTVTAVSGGGLFALKGMPQDPTPREQTVTLQEENASVFPFGHPDWRTRFSPHRVAIETIAGVVVQERADPRNSFDGHDLLTPWDPLHRAYFNGYAMWTYLTTPFFMTMPGFEVTEIAHWQEGAERWRGCEYDFPMKSPATAKSKTFTSARTFCCAGTIITSTSPAHSRSRNTSAM